jgi:diguanylate cyclase (GGDEF)-like protein/PAS domain S-box-containing protein
MAAGRLRSSRLARPTCVAATAVAVAAVLALSGALGVVEHRLADLRFGALQRPATGDVVLVEIDAKSLRALETWPWPRRYHATVLENLLAAGASRVAFDVDFSSLSAAEDDRRFAQALAQASPPVILPAFKQRVHGTDSETLVLTEPAEPFRPLVELASVNVRPAKDGLVRRIAISEPWKNGTLPSIAALLAGVETESADSFGIDYGISLDGIASLSFVDVLRGTFDASLVRGRKVLIGASAIELGDILPVPVHRALSGVRVHALAYQSLAQGRAVQPLDTAARLAILVCLALILAPVFARASWRTGLAALVAAAAAVAGLAFAAYAVFALMVDVAAPLVLLALLFVGALIGRVDNQAVRLLLQDLRLRRANALMRGVVESSFDGIVTFDEANQVVTANASACQIFRANGHGLAGRALAEILPDVRRGEIDGMRRSGGHLRLEARGLDGSAVPVEIAVSEMSGQPDSMLIAVVRDVTERKRQETLLRHQASHDLLTDLPNRLALTRAIERALVRAGEVSAPAALLLLDLDRFKEINDTLGHNVGDALLVDVARRLKQAAGDGNSIARLGGDEFAVLLAPPTTVERARAVADRMVKTLRSPYRINGLSLEMGASIGIALYPDHAHDCRRLLQSADIAMYMAKRDQSGVAVYDAARDRNSVRNLAMTGQLRQAIADRQISFQFQAKVDLATGKACGAEALARWEHGEIGFVPPEEFVALAETTGQIEPLTRLALDSALAELSAWRNEGHDIGVAVNLSARSVHDMALPKLVESRLAESGLDPARLTLEITESAVMQDSETAVRVLERLRDLGVRLSIDDFGTGYSSLAYIHRLPLTEIKIDKSFVERMTECERDRAIVRSTIALAHDLGLAVVAEGIETLAHREMIASFGCDVGQGYLFSTPLPGEAFVAWLDQSPWPKTGLVAGRSALERRSGLAAIGTR